MTRDTGPSKATVRAVWDRDEGRCARCGRELYGPSRGVGWSVHHRVDRGMGGSRVWWINLPGNLLLLCGSGTTGCHGKVTNNPAAAEQGGFSVRRGVILPEEIAVQHALFGVVFLLNDGTISYTPPEEKEHDRSAPDHAA